MKSARIVPLVFGVLTLAASGAAMAAGLNVGVNIGIPAPVYVAPAPVYAPPPPPPVVYQPAPVYYGGPQIVIGWHGNRYWDGHRYWARDDWYRHHPAGRGDYARGHYDQHRGWH
ncbi:hypothetical protein [Paraburkholderia tuberum]|uniref:PXPV repeat-containing protein n=1 Tax=Paraburkholderia tuberum TaxID=157910 RepID=A0A1H0ZNH1_9BURK|nr:hypothetical protein [Paraburkholderia tuberum]SDQ28894.1 hypothetical protein SAMN05445850_0134 [Paraburkholderia tuberum]